MANRWGTMETVTHFLFLGSKITAYGDCSYEIKRCLLLGSKVMTNLDRILKNRDIALLTNVHLVRAIVFPYIHVQKWELNYKESWALKNWCFWTVVFSREDSSWTTRSPLDYKEIQPVNLEGNQSWIFTEGLMLKLKLQYFGHLMWRTDSLDKTLMLGKIEGGRRRRWQRMRCLDGITGMVNMSWSKFREFDGQGSLACYSPWGRKGAERLSNWTEVNQRGILEWKLLLKESNRISITKNYTVWNLSPSHDLNIILEIVEGNGNKLEEKSVAAI